MYKNLMRMEVPIYSVKAKSQAGNMLVKYIITTQKSMTTSYQLSAMDLINYVFYQEFKQKA